MLPKIPLRTSISGTENVEENWQDKVLPNSPDFIDSVAPVTPQIDTITGGQIAEEFAKARQAAKEGIAADALLYLKHLSPAAVIEIVRLRRGADFGVTQELIRDTVLAAAELLEKQRKQT
jgi:hypothetical protein